MTNLREILPDGFTTDSELTGKNLDLAFVTEAPKPIKKYPLDILPDGFVTDEEVLLYDRKQAEVINRQP